MRDVTCASTSSASTTPKTTVLETFPAGAPRGSWPAEEFAAARRNEGQPVEVVMNLAADAFLVIAKAGS
jgi:hypothetical protein